MTDLTRDPARQRPQALSAAVSAVLSVAAGGDREHGRYGRRQRLRALAGGVTSEVGHECPSADFRMVATGRRPGNPPPVARRIADTYQAMNCCVNVSMLGESGPGA